MNKEKKLYNIPFLTILSIYITTYFIYNDFNIRFLMYVGYGILGILLLLIFISKIKNHQKIFNFSLIEIIYLIIPVIVLLNIARPDAGITKRILAYVLVIVISAGTVLLTKINKNEQDKILKLILLFTSIIAICETIYRLVPSTAQFMIKLSSDLGKGYNSDKITWGSNYVYAMGASIPYVGMMLMLGMAVSISYYYKTKNKINIFFICLFYFVTILLGRRGELLALTITLIITFFLLDNPNKRKKHLLIFSIAFISFIVLFILFMPLLKHVDLLNRYIATIEGLLNGQDITNERALSFSRAWNAFTDHPLIGIGWGNFASYTGNYFTDVHNIYLQFLCETGIFNSILIIGSLITLFVFTIILLNKSLKQNNENIKQLLIFSFITQCFSLLMGFVDPVFSHFIFHLFYSIAICFTATSYKTLKTNK